MRPLVSMATVSVTDLCPLSKREHELSLLPCSLALKRLIGVKRVWNGSLVHVEDITWIFPCKLCLHDFDEMLGLLLGLSEVLLCSVSSSTVG